MEVWVLQWDYPLDMEHNITLWVDETSALQQACTEIKQKIDGDWDMDDSDMEEAAQKFDTQLTGKNYRAAIGVWNRFQEDFKDDGGEWYSVIKYEVLGSSAIQGGCRPPSSPVAYRASSSGATCRGPCKTYNEYAYADQPDGTHMCRQCSTFQHIFGTKS